MLAVGLVASVVLALAVTATVAQGDLTVQVPVEGRDELSRLMLSLHHMKESLSLILLRVQDSATSVASASQQIVRANADLSLVVTMGDLSNSS